LVRYARELETQLADVTESTDADQLHATRIAAKRVRYVLEPLVPGLPDGVGAALVERFKRLQDLFGTLTDAHELDVALQHAGVAVAAATEVLHSEVANSFDQLRDRHGVAASLERDVAAAARRLRPVAKTPRSLQRPPRRRRRQSAG
jgi:CHAD domain-containing protein